MHPKVSIIVSSYNQRGYIREAVESALNQTYPNIEVIATDNGSTDGTQDVLKEFENNERVKIILQRQNGSLNTLANKGFALSTGEFIALLHGDDYLLPEKIERQMACFSRLTVDYGVVYSPNFRLNVISGEKWIDPCLEISGNILKEMLLKYHTEGNISIMGPLVRRECFDRYPFRESFFLEGESIFFRMAMKYKFHALNVPLGVMREHLGNMGKAIRLNRDWVIPLFDILGREPDFPSTLLPALHRFKGRLLRNCGWMGVRILQDPIWARECFVMAIRSDPAQLFHPRTLLGTGITLLPLRFVVMLNWIANQFIRHRENAVIKEDYV